MLVPTPTVSLRQCLDNISNAKVMFTAQSHLWWNFVLGW